MIKQKISVLVLCAFGLVWLHAQGDWKRPLGISVFTTGTQLPGGSLTPLHPGILLTTEFRHDASGRDRLFQTLNVGAYYHKYAQTGIQLYTELGYRRALWAQRLAAEARVGAGYLHAIPDLEVFRLEDGQYERSGRWGRPQLMCSVALSLGYYLGAYGRSPRLHVGYQFFVQTPFVRNYVPVLPNTAIQAGVAFPFFNR